MHQTCINSSLFCKPLTQLDKQSSASSWRKPNIIPHSSSGGGFLAHDRFYPWNDGGECKFPRTSYCSFYANLSYLPPSMESPAFQPVMCHVYYLPWHNEYHQRFLIFFFIMSRNEVPVSCASMLGLIGGFRETPCFIYTKLIDGTGNA